MSGQRSIRSMVRSKISWCSGWEMGAGGWMWGAVAAASLRQHGLVWMDLCPDLSCLFCLDNVSSTKAASLSHCILLFICSNNFNQKFALNTGRFFLFLFFFYYPRRCAWADVCVMNNLVLFWLFIICSPRWWRNRDREKGLHYFQVRSDIIKTCLNS